MQTSYVYNMGQPTFHEPSDNCVNQNKALNNFIWVLMKASTVLGMLQFASNSFLELSQTSRNKRLNEFQ